MTATDPITIPLPAAVPFDRLPDGGDLEVFNQWKDDYRRWSVQAANKVLDGATGPKLSRVSIKLSVVYRSIKRIITPEQLAPGIQGLKDAGVLAEDCVVEFDPDITYTSEQTFHQRIECEITPTE